MFCGARWAFSSIQKVDANPVFAEQSIKVSYLIFLGCCVDFINVIHALKKREFVLPDISGKARQSSIHRDAAGKLEADMHAESLK